MNPITLLGKTYQSKVTTTSSSDAWVPAVAILGIIFLALCLWGAFKMSGTKHHRKGGGLVSRSRMPNPDAKRINRWKIKRAAFEEQKKTPFFCDWKREQYSCQFGKCAWCRKPIDLHSPNTHVDHIKPLIWWGTNDYNNLVLACKECNEEKGDNQFGWAGAKGVNGENRKPCWIKPNRCCKNFKEERSETRRDTSFA